MKEMNDDGPRTNVGGNAETVARFGQVRDMRIGKMPIRQSRIRHAGSFSKGRLGIGAVASARAVLAGVLILTAFSARVSFAQQGGNAGDDFSLYVGYMLPNGIDQVTEVMPVFGGRYGLGLPLGSVEFEGTNTHSEGVDFTTFSASLRGEVPVGSGISGLIYGGPDLHWYIPRGDTQRHTDYGIHVGGAGLLLVTDSLWLRGDLKFNANPGTALYLLFGIMFRPSGAGR